MTTTIAIFTNVRNEETGKRERITVLPETIDLFDTNDLIVAYYVKPDDRYYTIPGTEYHHIASEWLAQFEIA